MRASAWRNSAIALLFSAAVTSPGPAANAQSDRATAEALFKEGRKASKAGDHSLACPKFAESHRLDPAPGTLLNLAECEEKLGKLASAWQRFEELTQTLERRDKRYDIAKRRAAELGELVPRLTIKFPDEQREGVSIALDGLVLSSAAVGVPLPVDPGDHVVVVTTTGREDARFTVALERKENRELVVESGPELARPAPEKRPPIAPVAPAAEAPSSSPTLGYVIGGIGVAGVATGLVLGVFVLDKKSVVDQECTSGQRRCTDEGLDAVSSGKSFSTAATVSFAIGLVGLGIGTYLVLSHEPEGAPRVAARAVPVDRGALFEIETRF